MPKTLKTSSIDLEKIIMTKVKLNEISMKPKWYFVIGSVLLLLGLVASVIVAVFLTNLTLFSLRQHGPNGQYRLQQLMSSFPLWVPIFAVFGIVLGIRILRKYDFSYKTNFWFVVLGFVFSVILAAILIDYFGFNDVWFRQGPMRRFYQHIEGRNLMFQRGLRQGKGQGYIWFGK